MIDRIKAFITKYSLLHNKDKVIIGVSGGADSILLVEILQLLQYNCIVAHCNFQLRGEESDRDEKFVVDYCNSKNLPYYVKSFDTNNYAITHKLSIEMAARELRYNWFESLRIDNNANAIAVAHHLNDSIETVFINIINGTGINGITGIKPKNNYIIRPLLEITRDEIIHFLDNNAIKYVNDSTNKENIYTRNIIRNEVIPLFNKINIGFTQTMFNNMENLNDVASIYNDYVREKITEIVELQEDNHVYINIDKLIQLKYGKTILFEILKSYHFTPKQCTNIFRNLSRLLVGKKFYSSSHTVLVERKHLMVCKTNKQDKTSYTIHQLSDFDTLPIHIVAEILPNNNNVEINKDNSFAYIDASTISFPLQLRLWHNGDYFYPLGMNQRKKVSDFLSDIKIDTIQKENTWVLTCNDKIVWIVGYRINNLNKITDKTETIFKLHLAIH